MTYAIRHLVITRPGGYSAVRQALDDTPDAELARRLGREQFPQITRNWVDDSHPEFDLLIREIREVLKADVETIYSAHRWEDPNVGLAFGALGDWNIASVWTRLQFGLQDHWGLLAATPVGRLASLHPLCGPNLSAPPSQGFLSQFAEMARPGVSPSYWEQYTRAGGGGGHEPRLTYGDPIWAAGDGMVTWEVRADG